MSKEYEDLLDQEVRKNHKKTIDAIQGFIFESYSFKVTDSDGTEREVKVSPEKNGILTRGLLDRHLYKGDPETKEIERNVAEKFCGKKDWNEE